MALVYFIELTNEDREVINILGWDCATGQNYLNAKAGRIDDSNKRMFKTAAEVNETEPEAIWVMLQNGVYEEFPSWTDNKNIKCRTNFPRSMDVGDVAVVDGVAWRCDDFGWKEITFEV